MMKTALIFGVTGQDGSYLADLLLSKGYEVYGVARRVSVDTTSRLCLAKKNEGFHLVEGDVTDALCVHRLISECYPEEIYNLAAQSHVGTSFHEPAHTFDVTAKGVLNCLEAIRSLTGPGSEYVGAMKGYPRFYQASSSEMFGSAYSTRTVFATAQIHIWEECNGREYYQDEATPMLPNSPYAVAKLAGHNLCRVYREAYGIHASSGILFNHESPRRGDNFVTRKISLWVAGLYARIRQSCIPSNTDFTKDAAAILAQGEYPHIFLGNLNASRDWGHAQDYVEAMWLMTQQEKPDDYVIATGETHTVREFLEASLRCIGVELKAEAVVAQCKALFRPCEVPYLRGDASKAREKLGWHPRHNFEQLVQTMVMADISRLLGNGKGGCS